MNCHSPDAVAISCNFESLKMKASRLLDRFHRVVKAIEQAPGKSFPSIFPKKAELDAFYRLMNNGRVSFSDIIASSRDATLNACSSQHLVLAIHDTTQFQFPGVEPIEGLGR